jgi:hypothetical protein
MPGSVKPQAEPKVEAWLAQYIESSPTKAPGLHDLVKAGYRDRVKDWLKSPVGLTMVAAPVSYLIVDLLGNWDAGWGAVRIAVWCVAVTLLVPAVLSVRFSVVEGNWYRLSAALAGVFLGLVVVLAPVAAVLATMATLLALYGGQQIGEYAANQQIRDAYHERTARLDQQEPKDEAHKRDEDLKSS